MGIITEVNLSLEAIAYNMDARDIAELANYVTLDAADIDRIRLTANVEMSDLLDQSGYGEVFSKLSPDLIEAALYSIHSDVCEYTSRACMTGVQEFIAAYLEQEEDGVQMLLETLATHLKDHGSKNFTRKQENFIKEEIYG